MSREFNYGKSIRALKNNAKRKNFYSALQLHDYFLKGKYVNPDGDEARRYLKMSYDIFKKQELKLEKIDIKSYRAFEEVLINDFDPNLNVFVGNNGAGKTTFLDAIELSLSWLSISINKNGGLGGLIDECDINNYSEQPSSSILSTIEINENIKADIALHKTKSGRSKFKNKVNEVKTVGGFYKIANEFDPEFNMPLLAYYNVMRSYDVNPKDLRNLDDIGT
ncbi:ATPase, partial [Salinivibrio sp. VYel6]|uniref:AAA family ATPase n=1 Tax=Salinivibrio sp. VYel6 TaxID=2490493 RepID=UPI00128C4C57